MAVVVNAVQQHRNKLELERRNEIAKHKSVVDDTETTLMAAQHIPVTQRLVFILQKRALDSLKVVNQLSPGVGDIKERIKSYETTLKAINVEQPPPAEDSFQLPQNDKQVIQFIRGIKNMRAVLRSEFKKGKVDSRVFVIEDKLLERMQLRANVDTLIRRGDLALKNNQLGSARQCLEKAIGALSAQPNPDEYVVARQAQLEEQLRNIQDNLKNANSMDVKKKQDSERNELDELFAQKKKW
ncbi:hypothetical protein AX660_18850 [Paraglaciecola hydrolytica]|uniref:Uncharacterized protein n=1 Tax=Paraglaciecola hydrolytica TaxID=1799789 RepID=A0A148KNT2_9ALTE|nr:hypothetical protein AX660_18850 [Paraglaciecola hydrolytica]